jgi:hypothetical protein
MPYTFTCQGNGAHRKGRRQMAHREIATFRVLLSTGHEHTVEATEAVKAVKAAVEADGYPSAMWIDWSGWNVSALVLAVGRETLDPAHMIVGDAYTADGRWVGGATIRISYPDQQ